MSPWRNLFRCERRTKNCTSDCKTAIAINKKKKQKPLLWTPAFACIIQDFVPFVPFFVRKKESEGLVWRCKNDGRHWANNQGQMANSLKPHQLRPSQTSQPALDMLKDTSIIGLHTIDAGHAYIGPQALVNMKPHGFRLQNLKLRNFKWKPKSLTFNKTFIPVWRSFLSHESFHFIKCSRIRKMWPADFASIWVPMPWSGSALTDKNSSLWAFPEWHVPWARYQEGEFGEFGYGWHWASSFEKGATSKISQLVASVKSPKGWEFVWKHQWHKWQLRSCFDFFLRVQRVPDLQTNFVMQDHHAKEVYQIQAIPNKPIGRPKCLCFCN